MYVATSRRSVGSGRDRLTVLYWFFAALGVLLVAKLFSLQIWNGASYRLWATNQHELQAKLIPQRGRILVRDRTDGSLHPLATTRDAWAGLPGPEGRKGPGGGGERAGAARGEGGGGA